MGHAENEKIEKIREFIRDKAELFGAKTNDTSNKDYVERNNTGAEALKDDGAYFGFIHPDEEVSGPYHDFSLVIFPSSDDKPWLISLGVGSNGFRNDYETSTLPGLRRLFSKLIDENGFCKSDFSDIETGLPREFIKRDDLSHIKKTIKRYSKFLSVCQIIQDPTSESSKKRIAAFVAGYAKLRNWGTNKKHTDEISNALDLYHKRDAVDEIAEINDLLEERRYIVLQGPPGTGKTRAAKKVAENFKAKVFFTQFHAETSYSDFIYGIRPDVSSEELRYKSYKGIFVEAVEYAIENKSQKTILIIDEINRANLSNILGPIFYLFEYRMDNSDIEIEICPGLKIKKLPENFFVIATMNSADRSLAVVDFALRRRFAWYTLMPRDVSSETANFYKEDFNKFQEIFYWYASSSELMLQPGQGYFIAGSGSEMKNRLRYELLPLIKEYLNEGLLQSAKEEFNSYFMEKIDTSLFE